MYYKRLRRLRRASNVSLDRLISPSELNVLEELAIELRLSGVNLYLSKPALVDHVGVDRYSVIDDVISLTVLQPGDSFGHIIGMKLVVPNEDLVPDLFSQLPYLDRMVVYVSEPLVRNSLLKKRELPESHDYILETYKRQSILKFRIGRTK